MGTIHYLTIEEGNMVPYDRMSACGLDCKTCGLLLFPENLRVQEGILSWFRHEKWIGESEGVKEAIAKKMYCKGCGDKKVHWGGDCEVANCCKNIKILSNCSECNDFPCDKYNKWLGSHPPAQGDKYQKAFEYIQQLRANC